ncbi:MAG: Putative NADH-dependent dehydrogenase [Cytophagales bacterium]|jgi:predicted dehydrogenase|nr:Gfo/Idh/MocA family oxidoreductase [Bacteroidota bacterium]MBS1981230.1 Gfo/Idh/MocA family oxidoreductase [Bacteroidota bacterium]WHZ06519.1 MAG: Putative NADH-dependent dehydrogenase [Cytophagales bacterium]
MISRRKFITQAATAATAFTIVPRFVLGKGHIAPSDTLYIAGIGVGGKGTSDLTGFAGSPDGKTVGSPHAKVVFLCDADDRQAVTSKRNFPNAKYYKDFRKMLDKEHKGIDACSVSTPDHTHAVAAMAAMQLGKHVYLQKPLTHDIYEARMLTQAARQYKVVTQMGNQGGSGDDVRSMKEWYDAGLIGDVTNVICWTNRPVWPQGVATPTGKFDVPKELDWDLWLGPAKSIEYNPAYLPFNWRGWWAFGTGALGDMACHIMDPVFRILPIDYPSEVECSTSTIWNGVFSESHHDDSCPVSSIVHFKYPGKNGKPDIELSWMDGGLLPKRPNELLPDEPMGNWDGGVIFEGTKGKIMADCYGENPRLLPTKLMKEVSFPKQTLARVPEGHYVQWVNACIKGYGNAETSSNFDYAGPFTESVLMGNLAIRSYALRQEGKYPGRKKLLWDAKNMKITNFDEANQFVKREYRAGWKL